MAIVSKTYWLKASSNCAGCGVLAFMATLPILVVSAVGDRVRSKARKHTVALSTFLKSGGKLVEF